MDVDETLEFANRRRALFHEPNLDSVFSLSVISWQAGVFIVGWSGRSERFLLFAETLAASLDLCNTA